MEYIKAFLVGGLLCMLVQVLLDRTKLMPGRVMVLLVVSGSFLGFLGLYEPFSKAMSEDGALGIFKGGFTASAVGISGALIFGYLGSLIFKPKMKS